MEKLLKWWILGTVAFVSLLFVAKLLWSPGTYFEYLETRPDSYAVVDDVAAGDLVEFLYCYEKNEYVNAFPRLGKQISYLSFNVADRNGFCPAFSCEGNIFVITKKRVNSSGGFVIPSADFEDFRGRLNDSQIEFGPPIKDGIRVFSLNLEG